MKGLHQIKITITIMAKTYNRMILNEIRPVLDPLLIQNQNEFRRKRKTVGQILAIRRILEGIKDKNLTTIFTFIDFKKAFDSIHRGNMAKVLRSYAIPDKLVDAINGSYIILEPKYIHQIVYLKS